MEVYFKSGYIKHRLVSPCWFEKGLELHPPTAARIEKKLPSPPHLIINNPRSR